MGNFKEVFEQAKLELPVFEENKKLICEEVLPVIFIAQINNFEVDNIKLKGKNSNKKFFKEIANLEKKHKVKFIVAKSSDAITMSVNNITNTIIFTSCSNVKYQSLLKRLRNAFFHNNFSIQNNFIYLKDINIRNKRKPTMLGKMKLNTFVELIEILLKYLNNQE